MQRAKRDECEKRLRANLQAKASEFAELLKNISDNWGYEDPVYRFYHHSFKVYHLRKQTEQLVETLQDLLPDVALNEWFVQIIRDGEREFSSESNERWLAETRPILEAFFHARFFLEMACRYSEPPPEGDALPSGWAALLYLFNLR